MVTQTSAASRRSTRGALSTDLAVAVSILALVMIPLGFSFVHEAKLCRAYYYRAAALEIIDGEMEVLFAGEWRAFPPGEHAYPVTAEAAQSLPPGEFKLTLADGRARLEWRPRDRGRGGKVAREVKLK